MRGHFTLFFSFLFTILSFSAGQAFTKVVSPSRSFVEKSQTKLVESRSRRWHEIKLQGGGEPVRIVNNRGNHVFWFEAIANGAERDRSEVRVKGADIRFSKWHYLKFQFLPSASADLNPDNDWNIILQIPQIFKATKENPVKSPPLSLQIRNGRLYIRTLQNYETWYSGKVKPFKMIDLGPVKHGRWNKVWLRLKMGRNGGVVGLLNNNPERKAYRPIGYKNSFNPFIKGAKVESGSVRFGIYRQGVPDDSYEELRRILFKSLSIGTDYLRRH